MTHFFLPRETLARLGGPFFVRPLLSQACNDLGTKALSVDQRRSVTMEKKEAKVAKEKNAFERNFGEGTAFDLDYGKLLIIALCIYIAVQVS